MNDPDYLALIEKLKSGQATDQQFQQCLDENKARLSEISGIEMAQEWAWLDRCPELFGKSDIKTELILRQRQLSSLKSEYQKLPKSQALNRLKKGKAIQEVQEIILKMEKQAKQENKK